MKLPCARVSSYLGLVQEGSEQIYPYLDERVIKNTNVSEDFERPTNLVTDLMN
jgi:hypothetical protein